MKKLILTICSIASLMITSCGEQERVIYDGDLSEGTLVSFTTARTSLGVNAGEQNTVQIPIEVSSVSSETRTFNVSVSLESTADASYYNVATQAVAAAGSHTAELEFTGIAADFDFDGKTVVLVLEEATGVSYGTTNHEVSFTISCPMGSDVFTGNYIANQTSAEVDGPTLVDDAVYNISATNAIGGRTFNTTTFPDYCDTAFIDFTFTLSCDKVLVDSIQTSCTCNQNYFFGPATVPATFDPTDDSSFTVTFTDDVQSDCSAPVQTTYEFTKQ